MKSPFTGGEAIRKFKFETFTFRKESYTVKRGYFQCKDTGKTFSNAETDVAVMNDLYAQYRKRHCIPSPEELKELRGKYGFSARTMSKIAGIGINQYSLYEKGEMPTIVVGQKLRSLFDKASLLRSIESSKAGLGRSYEKVREKVESYEEPFSLPIAVEYYDDYDETCPLSFKQICLPIRKPRWSCCSF